ncbi:hypothetical protein N0V90_009068 [Kalmusia sp. IMI 367209]|nr:hypothetical protein N0V90_009068 [Kalmusia sp. IMI 367209]
MSSFALDKRIFNPSLYKQLTNIWLAGVDTKGQELQEDVAKRWFRSDPELDGICRENFLHALEAIGPERLPVPTADPFIQELGAIAEQERNGDGSQAAWTALSMVLLLDQMPRNIFRTADGLVKVYNHYDKIALALVRRLLSPASPIPRPDLHPQWRNSFSHRMWFYLPLEHSEEIENHKTIDDILAEFSKDTEKSQDLNATKNLLQGFVKAEQEHRGVLDRFGRYPHRNIALGRESTEEEKAHLKDGGATFGVAQ